MSKEAIEWNEVHFAFNGQTVLRPSSFAIKQGACAGVMGPNGGGKTTLLKLLMGFLTTQSGSIRILGKPPIEARSHIGYVPQFLRADRDFPITTEELILLGCIANPEKKKDLATWLQRLGLSEHRHKSFGSLSGGLAQRALLARALISDPDVLLLDEPTASIDPPSAALIYELLKSLKGKKTVLLVTHDIKTIIERVDQILCVQGTITSYLPGQVCEHFAMGLYHTPLLEIPKNHLE